jgi:hypothetical protein
LKGSMLLNETSLQHEKGSRTCAQLGRQNLLPQGHTGSRYRLPCKITHYSFDLKLTAVADVLYNISLL